MKKALIAIMAVALISSCCMYDIDEVLLKRDDVSITQKGNVLMSYDPLTCQMSHNHADNTFMVYDDTIANWFIVSCNTDPTTVGQELTADVTWTTRTDTKIEKDLKLTVEKTDQNGNIWLWNKSRCIGIVIKRL